MTNKNCTEVFFGLFSKLPEGNILILKQVLYLGLDFSY